MTADTPSPSNAPGTERLLAFSDGIFAIAITLLVLNIGVDTAHHRLPQELTRIWPEYLSYALSFFTIGIVWAQHHTIFTMIKRTDHIFLLINVFFLMWLSFLPFPTHVLGTELEGHDQTAAMALYAGIWVVGTVPFNVLWLYASSQGRLLAADVDQHLVQVTTRTYLLGPVIYGIDFLLAFVNVPVSLGWYILMSLIYAVAPIPAVGRSRLLRPITGFTDPSQ